MWLFRIGSICCLLLGRQMQGTGQPFEQQSDRVGPTARRALGPEVPDDQERHRRAAEHARQQNDHPEEGHPPVMQPAEQNGRALAAFVWIYWTAHEIASTISFSGPADRV